MTQLLDRIGPYRDGDADIYFCIFSNGGHVYSKRLVLGGAAKAVGRRHIELAYQTAKAKRQLEREAA